MSNFTPQEKEEFEFRQRMEQEQAQAQPQAQSANDARDVSEATNSVLYPAAGAVAAAAAGNLPSKIVNGMVKDPVTGKWMAVENYGRQMAQGKYYGGKNYDQVWDKIREYNADPTQGPRLEKEAMANRSTGQKMLANTPKPLQGIVSAPMGTLGRAAVGLGAGMQAADVMNRYNAGDTSGAIISGIGALGTTAAMAPHPVARIGGTAVGLGAEGLNMFLDKLKNKKQMAKGGLVDEEDGLSKAEKAALRIMKKKKKVKKLADGGLVGALQAPRLPDSSAPVQDVFPTSQGMRLDQREYDLANPNTRNDIDYVGPGGLGTQPKAPLAPMAPTDGIIKETLVPDGKGGYYDTASKSLSVPANYQQARSAFDKQREAQRASDPFGGMSASVVGNDQFGQQFGYAADADAFNTFYNQNYGTATPSSTAQYKTGFPPVTTATGDSSFSNTGGLGGLLSGNNPMSPTTPPAYKPMPGTLAEYQAQRGNGPMAAVVDPWAGTVDASGTWVRNPDQNASYAAYAAQQNAQNSPRPSGGLPSLTGTTLPPGNNTNLTPTPMPVMNGGAAQINPNVNFANAMRPGAKPNVFNKFGTPLNQIRQSPGTAPQARSLGTPTRRMPRLLRPR